MKQILQDLRNGKTELIEAPQPQAKNGQVLVQTCCSLISAGTERMLVDFGKGSYFQKARQQPEKVKMVLEKARTDGIMATYEAVRSKLEQPIMLGYSNVGVVSEDVRTKNAAAQFRPGDRVVSNGPHAEVVRVPENLCARIPDNVSDEAAVFTVVGAIGLQGIRLAGPSLGEAFVVIGAGLIGLITVQLLGAHGCRVMAVDFDESKLEMARKFGAETCNPGKGEDPVAVGMAFSRGRGVDGVLICAATKSNEPVSQAARMCRKRGRIVLVGVTGLELNRAEFYEKELSFQVSCSYGPGRYDPEYEDKGQDYPLGFVRWTAQRNFEAVLDMMADGRLDVTPLISHRFPIDQAEEAYRVLTEEKGVLGILLEYPRSGEKKESDARTVVLRDEVAADPEKPTVSFIGAGNYAGRVLIPAFKEAGASLVAVASSGGVSGVHYGRKHGFQRASTDSTELIADAGTNAVVIATRHNTHAGLVIEALEAGKHVFVEKPLCLTCEELDRIQDTYSSVVKNQKPCLLMVGFNRRFAPQVKKIKSLLEGVKEPKAFAMTVNAGAIPADHWTQDPEVGGGRIIGEACHFIDLMRFLAGASINDFQATYMGENQGMRALDDKTSITLKFGDGSMGTIHYLANGHRSFPKERLEVFAGGRVLQLDNFRRLSGYGWRGFRKNTLWRQDKGQKACVKAFVDAIRNGGTSPIPFDELMEVSRVTIAAAGRDA